RIFCAPCRSCATATASCSTRRSSPRWWHAERGWSRYRSPRATSSRRRACRSGRAWSTACARCSCWRASGSTSAWAAGRCCAVRRLLAEVVAERMGVVAKAQSPFRKAVAELGVLEDPQLLVEGLQEITLERHIGRVEVAPVDVLQVVDLVVREQRAALLEPAH